MNDMSPSIESIVQMSDVSRARFNCINSFARAHNITISGLYFYVAIGALNIEKLSGEQVIYTNGYSLQPTWAQSRMPMDRIVSGACVSFFHASHAASTIAS